MAADPIDLARAALVIAKIEHPCLDPHPVLDRLDQLGHGAERRLARLADAPVRARLDTLNNFFYREERFTGNRAQYGDIRNSLLNDVVGRRLGIPISLGLVYMEVARRSGLEILGVAFPGHFLLRVPADAGDEDGEPLVLDPFDSGRELTHEDLKALLACHAGQDAVYSRALLRPCTGRQLLVRLLSNLKRNYLEMRSFPHAWLAADLLLALDPTLLTERRDRGLLAYHQEDFVSALADLEDYVRLQDWADREPHERGRVDEHLTALGRRVALLN